MRWLVIAAALGLLTAAPAAADELNPELERARQLKRSLDYRAARDALARALATGGNSPEQLAAIYRLSAEVAAGLGDSAGAELSFRRLLALQPDAQLPPGTSPKFVAPFERARAYFADRKPLQVDHRVQQGHQPALQLSITSDPLAMVGGARVQYLEPGGRWLTTEVRGSGTLRVSLPESEILSLAIAVIDDAGNQLVRIGTRERPLEVRTAALLSGRSSPGDDRPVWIARWHPWAGLSILAAGTATYFGIDVVRTEDDLADIYADAEITEFATVAGRIDDLRNRGQRSALITNISIAAAATTALFATYLYIRERRDRPPPPSAPLSWRF